MGYVVKETALRFVRLDTFTQVDDPKVVEELSKTVGVEKRRGIGIIVYLESDFSDFYSKHVLRHHERPIFTVLVKNNDQIPVPKEARNLVELALMKGKREGEHIFAPLPQPDPKAVFATRTWDRVNETYLNDPNPKGFCFRGITDIKSKADFARLSELDQFESQRAFLIYKTSFTSQADYTVDYVWLVEHILIYHPGFRMDVD